MRARPSFKLLRPALFSATILSGLTLAAPQVRAEVGPGQAGNNGQLPLPTGQYVTPTLPTGSKIQLLNPGLADFPSHVAGDAVKAAVSPDGNTLLVLTSGYNLLNNPTTGVQINADSNEYVFVFDISGANRASPVQTQVLQVPNTYVGLVWAPDGGSFYASGGVDDVVNVFTKSGSGFSQAAAIPLGHNNTGIGLRVQPQAAGLGLSADGSVLVVANMYNDSISVIDTATRTVRFEYDLRPYNTTPGLDGVAGGEYPFTVAVKGNGTAYVSSIRDREIVVVDISGATSGHLVARVPVGGSPNSIILNQAQTRLFTTLDNTDQVAAIDTASNAVVELIDTAAPPGLLANATRYTGAAPNNLALSPDERTLYVTNGGANSVAVISLAGPAPHRVAGLIPTGWLPHSISLSADGGFAYIVNGKSDPGANPANLYGNTDLLTTVSYPGGNAAALAQTNGANQYVLQLNRASLASLPVPAAGDLPLLTSQVASNNRYNIAPDPADTFVMSALRDRIKHVVYIVKENRTYDGVLGDLSNGANGDPTLAVFGRRVTPSQHRIANTFVTLDNFFTAGDVSLDGWSWSTQGRTTDSVAKNMPVNYAGRGVSYDTEGQNRNISVGQPTTAAREAAFPGYTALTGALKGGTANVLPGVANVGAIDGPGGKVQGGYIWDSAIRAGLTVRNYGFLVDLTRYFAAGTPVFVPPTLRTPSATGTQVAFPANPTLIPLTDIYYRGYDNAFPDVWRVEEWQREFDQFVANGNLPNLTLLRLMHDHTGQFGTAVGGFNTPELQVADNDLAVGRVIEAISRSRYAADTLVFILEDDSQDGPDHIDAHRSTAYVVGPYVKQGAVVSTRYNTVSMLRTMEDVLGIDHLNLNDAYQRPMTDVFDLNQTGWSYSSLASPLLRTTEAAVLGMETLFAEGPAMRPTHDAAYWAEATRGFDWTAEDRVPADLFNQVLWEGLTDGRPFPVVRSGLSLRR
jgi:DNA-binding beta-propeller fold protein YncE